MGHVCVNRTVANNYQFACFSSVYLHYRTESSCDRDSDAALSARLLGFMWKSRDLLSSTNHSSRGFRSASLLQ